MNVSRVGENKLTGMTDVRAARYAGVSSVPAMFWPDVYFNPLTLRGLSFILFLQDWYFSAIKKLKSRDTIAKKMSEIHIYVVSKEAITSNKFIELYLNSKNPF